ncbi:starch phosphorylase [Desulfocicer vacuolatum DSM 3385]|uniref:Alpha-1,4 glucan phosphorylase n=1 Tax=Desulfocicer vacuolatum DSM 3385 TaxID=1121400 RepID=A0A1W2AEW3_9BACT|nr:glycogen/starch/alpha-glucan phosphorylase [Desulfocicer vacuolatum]SMC58991.1 starch phosphorylase [Desulfocicer vacuolatum DSM 3385]
MDSIIKPDLSGFENTIRDYVRYVLGKPMTDATSTDLFNGVSSAVRKLLMDIRIETEQRYDRRDVKRMHYISMEFLTGPLLANNLLNMGIQEDVRAILKNMGLDLDILMACEPDPSLGNGGLGRLAACFLDSLASLDMPGFGYGINYDYGLFKQSIMGGYQREKPDYWPSRSSPWLIARSGEKCMVPVYGRIVDTEDIEGGYNPMWSEWKLVVGRPHDIPVVGYGGHTANRLRLFSAWASEDFDIQIFNEGDYFRAVERKISSENISKILYPSDSQEAGRELRLVQEYFLVACAVQDIIRIYLKQHDDFNQFSKKVAIQLNDTHPALTVAELMRSLVDVHGLEWDNAWDITTQTLAYTNHTLLPEALEKWPLAIVEKVIPRHLQIIYEINRRFLETLTVNYPDDPQRLHRMSIIEEGDEKQVRMAHLAIVGSHSVNGVAKIHSHLVKTGLVPDFYDLWPEKFNNKTNGVTPRRWLLSANPGLARLITESIGDKWIVDLDTLKALESLGRDPAFLEKFSMIKRENKVRLARLIKKTAYIDVDPDSIFDIHAKRIHEYKRQFLNVMHIIHGYFMIQEEGVIPTAPRTYIFSGKAAPGYFLAKLLIRLIHGVADVVNKDPLVSQWIKVAFIPDYKVSLAEIIIPGADVSEQISTAGMEASGTGNMKFAINGAVTMGTMDGANIEIAEAVGPDNIYIFGHDVEEIQAMRGAYDPGKILAQSPHIQRVLNAVNSPLFCGWENDLFFPLFDAVVNHGDYYMNLADFQSYVDAQVRLSGDYVDKKKWAQMTLLNTARTGIFSSDRTIREYAGEVWGLERQI